MSGQATENRVKQYEITIASSGKTFTVNEGENILSAALRQGVMLPYSCKNGTCGSCKGMVDGGSVHIQVRILPARVLEKQFLSENVVKLVLCLPKSQRLQFLAGQYVDVLLSGGKRRAFSIASCPTLENEIELHIRHVDGGDFTGWVFDELKVRDILRFEGPQGNFFVRNDQPERSMIMMGGGTGFAPLKSMIENLIEHGDRREIHLYWGARNRAELYMDELPRSWAELYEHIHYHRAVSEPEGTASDDTYSGLVHEAVAAGHPDLSGFDVYMSGPPAMIEAAKPAFLELGLPEDRLFYDSFEFGLDVPVRVLSKPH